MVKCLCLQCRRLGGGGLEIRLNILMCPLMKAQISNRKVNTMLFDKRCKKPGHFKKITYEFIIRLPKKELRERLKELRC